MHIALSIVRPPSPHWPSNLDILDAQEDFRVTKGEPRIYESTVKGQRSFCGRCGTQLVFQTLGGLNLDITIASLDTPDALQPEAHIWTSSQRAFMNTNDLPSYRSERAGSGGQ